jgi:hypothetical protein
MTPLGRMGHISHPIIGSFTAGQCFQTPALWRIFPTGRTEGSSVSIMVKLVHAPPVFQGMSLRALLALFGWLIGIHVTCFPRTASNRGCAGKFNKPVPSIRADQGARCRLVSRSEESRAFIGRIDGGLAHNGEGGGAAECLCRVFLHGISRPAHQGMAEWHGSYSPCSAPTLLGWERRGSREVISRTSRYMDLRR